MQIRSLTLAMGITFFLARGSITLAAAPHPHPHEHELPEIIVTADPLGDVDSHFAAPVAVMTAKELRKSSMRSVGEAVSTQLGVHSSDFGASVGRPVIRGLGGGRVRVLENGIGSMDLSTISADHGVSIEPLFAEQIEILRGPATLLYGSGASGGLVNINNERILKTVPENANAALYSHWDTASEGWLAAAQANAPLGRAIAVHVDVLGRNTDDVDIPGFASIEPDDDDEPGTLVNSDGESLNFSGGLSWVGDDGYLGFNVSRLENEYGVPVEHGHGHDEEEEEEEAAEGGTRIDLSQTRFDVDGRFHLDRLFIETARVRWGFNDYEHDEIEGSGEIGTRFSNREWEGRLEFVLQAMGPWDGVIGFQFRDQDYSAIGEEAFVPPAELDSQALFIFEKADFGNIHVDLGLRLETQHAAGESPSGSADHNLISVSAGSTWTYAPGFELGVSFARSQRAPRIEELLANGPHLASNTFEIGDIDLGEETSTNVDVFWRKLTGQVRLDFNVFYNDIDALVFLEANDRNADGIADRVEDDFSDTGEIVLEDNALLLVSQTQRDAQFWGFELAVDVTVFDDKRGLLDLRIWTDYVDGEIAGGDKVPRIPPLRFGGGFEWERARAYAGFEVIHVTRQDEHGRLETATDAYTLVNIHAGYRFRLQDIGDLTVFARGTNLADETARRHTSFIKDVAPLPGASGLIGMRIEF